MNANRRVLRRVLWTAGGLLTLATLITVAIHIAPVRRLLGWAPLGQASTAGGGCPFGYGGGDESAAAALTPRVPRALPSDAVRAQARPALGFVLHQTSNADVRRWASEHDITCRESRGGLQLECDGIAAGLTDGTLAVSAAWLSFASDGTLRAVQTVRKSADVGAVSAAFDETRASLTRTVGTPSDDDGRASPERLRANLLAQASVEYRFADYRAVLKATHLADGFALTESYAALD